MVKKWSQEIINLRRVHNLRTITDSKRGSIMERSTVTEEGYEKFKNLLRFFYAQYRYNRTAGGAGGVRKVPHPDASNTRYDLQGHLDQFHLGEFQNKPLQIGDLSFTITFSGQWGHMGSGPNTFIYLCGTDIGLYLNLKAFKGDSEATTDEPFRDFFTWDDPHQEPTTLYVGEREGSITNCDKYGSYKFVDLGLGENEPTTDQLKDLYAKLQKLNSRAKAQQHASQEHIPTTLDAPRNWILFGAPGTGKSYTINKAAGQYPHRRVTFHPDYTYAQFVGSYKPVVSSESSSGITYDFVPGPFVDTLIEALDQPTIPHILIIEEINRADPAAVFGDVFQLLDRSGSGSSEYTVHTSPELKNYLRINLSDEAKQNLRALVSDIDKRSGDAPEASDCSEIAIPSNMYIWASMNSADQGVFPMDTAFKRRWTFQYLAIDGNVMEPKDVDGAILSDHWDEIRTNINHLIKDGGQDIPEEKLLGQYFLSSNEQTADNIVQAFSSKVIMYLFEDAARYCRSQIFNTDGSQGQLYLSDLLTNLSTSKTNLGIFANPVMTLETSAEPEERIQSITDETTESSEEQGGTESPESPEESAE